MTGNRITRMLRIVTGVLPGALLALAAGGGHAAAGEDPTLVVGTFDSRAVAVAYAQSQAFRDYLVALKADVDQARERARRAGDDQLVAQLDALGPAMQRRLHEQGFGTASVDDILARIESRLPDIAREAGVDVIVSKWVLTYRDPGARFVDVTGLIAAEFDPSERTLEMLRSLAETEPIPLDQIDHDH